ncbi:hypothetical protein E2C01_011707 [Portunus trituberculatus]|uniref:Uncharacterized protein n=1 Tax=Portunus trituberculatus TaxID=210409 RepID=A0A5B7DBS2_PORTR|nr:hypothetical protein [Portunus trituberculatus]
MQQGGNGEELEGRLRPLDLPPQQPPQVLGWSTASGREDSPRTTKLSVPKMLVSFTLFSSTKE